MTARTAARITFCLVLMFWLGVLLLLVTWLQ